METDPKQFGLYHDLGAGDVDTYGLLNHLLKSPGGVKNLESLKKLAINGKPLTILADRYGDEGLVFMVDNMSSMGKYELTIFLYQIKRAVFIGDQKRQPSEEETEELYRKAQLEYIELQEARKNEKQIK